MAHLQHIPGDPRLVDQLVYELKSKGIFDQFRKECIADVDTRPAYQNLRQRVENSVTTFLSRQCWQPDLNKNQLREKLRKHILDGNYLEQGVERIVDQVVNPKVASVFIPQVEDLVYNYLGITRKKSTSNAETSKEKYDSDSLLPTDLEAVSPGSVKSNDDKNDDMDTSDTIHDTKMELDDDISKDNIIDGVEKLEQDTKMSTEDILQENDSIDKSKIPLPTEGIKLDSIPHPKDSPPKIEESNIELEKIELPKHIKEPVLSEIPLPDELPKQEKNTFFKPPNTDEEDESSSDSSLRRNMSPLTPVRNFDNENSCDAQQAFDNDLSNKTPDMKEPSSFRFTIDAKSSENSSDETKQDKKDGEKLSYQFNNQININTMNTPMYDDSSNSNNLHIDYESDANSKIVNTDSKLEPEQISEDAKKEKKPDDKKPSHRSSHRSRDSHRHSSSKDKRSDSKHSTSRDSSRHDKKSSSKDETNKSKSNLKESSKEKSDKKENSDRSDSSKHRSSHKSSSKDKDSKNRTSSSSSRHSTKHDVKKPSSSSTLKDKEKDKSSDKSSKEKSSKDSRSSSSHRSSRDDKKKSSSGSSSNSKKHEKEKDKKEKKDTDDHYSLSGRGNHNRRSTDRDSNDESSSSKGSQNITSAKSAESKKESKSSSSKSGTTSTSSDTSPSDKDKAPADASTRNMQPVVRIDNHLEMPFASPPRLPFVPDVTMKKPKIASNMEEAKKMIKMRKFLEEEQKRMNQEAALLLEFQANVRPSLSQVYSSIPGPELEFACITSSDDNQSVIVNNNKRPSKQIETDKNQLIKSNQVKIESIKTSEVAMARQNIVEELSVEQQLENIYAASYGEEENDNNKNIELATKINSTDSTISENDTSHSTAEDNSGDLSFVSIDYQIMDKTELENILDGKHDSSFESEIEVTVVSLDSSEEESLILDKDDAQDSKQEKPFTYFTESDKFNSELERVRFDKFLKSYMNKSVKDKMFLINCDPYEENVIREVSKSIGDFEIVNYVKNGHLKLINNANNVVKDVNVEEEIKLPVDNEDKEIFSPIKSECSFELSSDYDAKIDDMVNTTSRQQIMEIILGSVEESPSKLPEINFYSETVAETHMESPRKRKLSDIATTNNNSDVLTTPNKIRKISETDQISSTTEESVPEQPSNKIMNVGRSKYLMKARRVGLPKPKRTELSNSPSSDKSVENYENDSKSQTPNGKIKTVQRNKVQRYDKSDLYKPKLHYLSRRNHIT